MTRIDTRRIGRHPGRSAANNVIAFLDAHRAAAPGRTALLWAAPLDAWRADPAAGLAHERMTCGELADRVEAAAAGLAELGLAAGDRAFLFIPMSPALYVAMFAVQRLGAIAVFLDSWARRDQLGACAAKVEPTAFIGPEPAFALADGIGPLAAAPIRVVVGPSQRQYSATLDGLAATGRRCPMAAVAAADTALVTFTTGSSGPPKGADRTHGFLAAQHRALDACLPYAADDVDLPVFPIFSLNNIAAGVPTVLPAVDLARPAETDGAVLAAQIRSTGATSCTLSPSLLRGVSAFAASHGIRLEGLRRAATGGAPISPDDVAAFARAAPNAELHILYGSTEVEPIAHLLARDMPAESHAGVAAEKVSDTQAANAPELGGRAGGVSDTFSASDAATPEGPASTPAGGVCVGRLAAGLRHKLLQPADGPIALDERGWGPLLAAAGEVGELAVAGEHVCGGYYKDPEAFARAKIVDADGVAWHRTGDLCRFDAGGRLWFVGRVHSAIRRAGRVLVPVEAEVLIKRLPFVAAAAYLGMPDATLGERAVAAFSVRPEAGQKDFAAEVRRALAAAGVVADEVVQVAAIPLDPRHHSKVEYARLREMLAGPPSVASETASDTAAPPSFVSRWGTFLRERFSPAATLLMVAAFFAGNAGLAAALLRGWPSVWPGIPAFLTVLLIFLRLRIFDEIKDCRHDRTAHPDRPLARGLISPREAKQVAAAVAAVEAALAAACGLAAIIAWAAVLGFSLLMYREFFIGRWLRPKMELYAVAHTLVSGGMGLFLAAALPGPYLWNMWPEALAFILINWAVFNVFEFARKTFGRDEEDPRIESYSHRLRPWGAALLCMSQVGIAAAALGWLLDDAGGPWAMQVAVAVAILPAAASVVYVLRPRRAAARAYRATMQVFIVGFYVVLAACVARIWMLGGLP